MIENVKVGSLPEDWREQLHAKSDTRITVRIEEAAEQTAANQPEPFVTYTIPRLASGVIA